MCSCAARGTALPGSQCVPPRAVTSRATWGEHWAACRGRAGAGFGEIRSPGLCWEPGPSTFAPHGPLSLGPKASRIGVLTTDWGEGVVSCTEAEHRDLDGIYLGSWACCLVVGNTILIPKGPSCVALTKLVNCGPVCDGR